MHQTWYQNLKTKKIVYIKKKNKNFVRVQYLHSHETSWFRKGEFQSLFKKLK